MGYGKTTSVRSYLNKKQVEPVWVSLLGSDGSEIVFWHKLSVAIGRLDPEIGDQLNKHGFPIDALQIAKSIDLITNLIGDEPVVIVIDDYHIIENNKHIDQLVELIIQEEIANLHIVLISRNRPRFNHINLISKRLSYYLDTSILAFTIQEVKTYFEFMKVSISEQELDRIYSYTKGWISAVYLMLLGLQRNIPVTEISNINQLVESNLFDTLSQKMQHTLVSLAVLDSFTLPKAIRVLDDPEVSQIVEHLMNINAFIEFNQQTKTYKLHHVLLDFLRSKHSSDDKEIQKLYHRAGSWYLEQGEINYALDHYYRAGKIEELFEHLNHMENQEISYLGLELQLKICAIQPHELWIKYPFPFLHIASNFILSGVESAARQGVEILMTMQEYFASASGISESLRKRILGEIEVISILLVFNDTNKMIEHAAKANELLDGNISCVVFRDGEFTLGMPHFLYTYYREAGKLKETLDSILSGFPPKVYDGCGTGCDVLAMAEYALETGDLANAELYARKSIYKAQAMNQIGIIICANLTLMRLFLVQGNAAGAKELMTQTKTLLTQSRQNMTAQSNAIYNTTLDLCEGYLYGCLKVTEVIPPWVRTGNMESNVFMFQGMAFPCIVYGKAVLLSENWVELEVLCEGFKERYAFFSNQLGLLHNAIYEAIASFHLHGKEAGTSILLPALREAQMDDIILPFAENADFLLPMLYELRGTSDLDCIYLERVILSSEQYSETLKAMQPNTSLLTEREVQVLRLLAQGMKQREIADALYLSISSVKRYLESIYQKLEANNKITAVKNAERLNIL
jgi:LuxR family maltose regulon positive regulatory protein